MATLGPIRRPSAARGRAPTMPPPVTRTVTSTSGRRVEIGPLRVAEHAALYRLFARIVADGDGFPQGAPLTVAAFAATWVRGVVAAVAARVATSDGVELVGAYYLRPNFVGRAAHIANAGYAVARPWRRQGIGRLLVEDSVWRAPSAGFDAIQFNLVFASNPARTLYESLGWVCVGRVPDAVGGEDALVYHRALS